MRHRKHNHQLGVKTAHRSSLIANLSCSLIENGRIKTTLAKARALRPFIEKAITLAKNAHATDDAAQKVHYRRLAIARLRSKPAVKKLFDELVDQFVSRNGGYTRIYKLALPRLGDAADMALIEFVEEAPKKKAKKKKGASKKVKSSTKSAEAVASDSSDGKHDTVVEVKKTEVSKDIDGSTEVTKSSKGNKEVKSKESSDSEDSDVAEKKEEDK